jgi:predicted small lipoprotein YifL
MTNRLVGCIVALAAILSLTACGGGGPSTGLTISPAPYQTDVIPRYPAISTQDALARIQTIPIYRDKACRKDSGRIIRLITTSPAPGTVEIQLVPDVPVIGLGVFVYATQGSVSYKSDIGWGMPMPQNDDWRWTARAMGADLMIFRTSAMFGLRFASKTSQGGTLILDGILPDTRFLIMAMTVDI